MSNVNKGNRPASVRVSDSSSSRERVNGSNKRPSLGNPLYRCYYANARSLRAKMGELECLVARENIDIVGITETWWNAENQWDTAIPGYKLYRRDREGRIGGGVAIYVKEGIESSKIEIEGGPDSTIESLWVKLPGQKNDVIVGVCYRPPDQTIEGDLEMGKQFREVTKKDKVVIMGDFNYPHIDWVNWCSGQAKETGFLDELNDCALEQLVMEPTRGQVTLDLILCGNQDLVRDVNVTEPLGNSDHHAIGFAMHVQERVQSKSDTKTLDFRRADFPQMRRLVRKKLKGKVKRVQSLQAAWRLFKTTVVEAQRKCIPQRKKGSARSRRVPAWLTNNVREAVKSKEASFRKWKSCPNEETKKEHKLWQKTCKRVIREAKKEFEERMASDIKGNNKSFFKYVRSRKPAREAVGPLDGEGGGEEIKGDLEIAEKLNEFFASVFTAEDLGQIPLPGQPPLTKELSQIMVNKDDVLDQIDKLIINKSPGPDGIHPRVIKELRNEVADLLTRVCNLSLKTATVPEDWRIANVTPIFKKGRRGDPGNYRPVSLTSVPGKMVESLIKDRIIKHVEEQALMMESQHGFCKGRSCLTNLLEFFEKVNRHVDVGEPVDIVYLDFQKAFDTVPHQRLLRKLHSQGIRGQVLLWIQNWLRARKQRVGGQWAIVTMERGEKWSAPRICLGAGAFQFVH